MPFDNIAGAEPPKKNKGGRPTKEEVARREAAKRASEQQAKSADSLFTSTPPAASPGSVPAGVMQPTPASTGIPHEVIRNGLEMPFAMAAAKTGFSGFALSKAESDPLVPMADTVMAKWLPTIGPYGVELMFCGSILALAGVKYMAYLDYKKAGKDIDRQLKEVRRETRMEPSVSRVES